MKEDNPVPSLDDLLKEFEESNYTRDIFTYHTFIKDKLENGRTSDKEQPKDDDSTCQICGGYYG